MKTVKTLTCARILFCARTRVGVPSRRLPPGLENKRERKINFFFQQITPASAPRDYISKVFAKVYAYRR